jgi:methylamine dehydrogenase heavy chain
MSGPPRIANSTLDSLVGILVFLCALCAMVSTEVATAESTLSAEVKAASGTFESIERPGVATLPPPGDHWVWVPDRLLGHSLLYDGDSGTVLGMIDSPLSLTPQPPIISTDRNEIYSVDVAYARGVRGDRTDFLTIYDLETLAYKDEIVFPTRAATGNTSIGYSSAIGSRFVGVFNQFPATSVSILDLDSRSFVEEIGVSGCSGIYAIDELRFATLCGDGTATVVELTDEGRKSNLIRSEKFFDTLEDPVFTSAGRIGSRWIFVSFGGMVHTVDFAGKTPKASPAWSLHGESGGPSGWRPGGLQLVTVHAASERLFVVMHEGGPGSHKDAGPEIWSFDLTKKKQIGRIEPPSLSASFLGGMLGISTDSFGFTLLKWILPADTVHSIAISQDAVPVLFMRNAELGAIGVVHPDGGQALRILGEAGLFGPTLGIP